MKPILVVEDDVTIRESMRSLLVDEGYEVYCAANGRVALNLLAAIPRPCVILVDLMMPVMDGRELLAELKNDDRLARIPVAVVSAARNLSGLETADAVLKKPFGLEELLDVVARMVEDAPESESELEQLSRRAELGRVSVPSQVAPTAPMSTPQHAAVADQGEGYGGEPAAGDPVADADPPAGDPPAG
jgi:CheY-like chemotaxis protein